MAESDDRVCHHHSMGVPGAFAVTPIVPPRTEERQASSESYDEGRGRGGLPPAPPPPGYDGASAADTSGDGFYGGARSPPDGSEALLAGGGHGIEAGGGGPTLPIEEPIAVLVTDREADDGEQQTDAAARVADGHLHDGAYGADALRGEDRDDRQNRQQYVVDDNMSDIPSVAASVTAVFESKEQEENTARSRDGPKRRRLTLLLAVCVSLCVVVAIVVAVLVSASDGEGKQQQGSSGQGTGSSTAMPGVESERFAAMKAVLAPLYGTSSDGSSSVSDGEDDEGANPTELHFDNIASPQRRALSWLADHDGAQVDAVPTNPRLVQRYALAVLYFSTGGGIDRAGSGSAGGGGWAKHADALGFLSDEHECDWGEGEGGLFEYGVELSESDRLEINDGSSDTGRRGVTCDSRGDVTVLNLNGCGLPGTIPSEIGFFHKLGKLVLRDNDLTGTIPSQLAQPTQRMTHLDLSQNRLAGPMPSSLGDLSDLNELQLDSNALTGTILPEIGYLTELRVLKLNINKLTGTVPETFVNLRVVKELTLENNDLTGSMDFVCDSLQIGFLTADTDEVACDCCHV